MISIDLPPEVEARLMTEARARGVKIQTYVEELIQTAISSGSSPKLRTKTPEEIESFLDAMSVNSEKIEQLPDEAFLRSSFYRDHD